MLKPKSPQESFYGSYLYDRSVPIDHLLRKVNQVVEFSFARQLFEGRYHPDIGRRAEDPEFMLRLCLLQFIYGDSDRQVVENARLNLAYKYFLGLAVDAEVPDYTTISYFRVQRIGEEIFRPVLEQIVGQCIDEGLVKGNRQIIDSTPVIANISLSSITGLVRNCRENVLETIEKQDTKVDYNYDSRWDYHKNSQILTNAIDKAHWLLSLQQNREGQEIILASLYLDP
jgi:transposase